METNSGPFNDLIIDELKLSYSRQIELLKNLEEKSTNVIKICGLIFALIFGFLGYYKLEFIYEARIFLLLSIIISLCCILISSKVSLLKKHPYPMTKLEGLHSLKSLDPIVIRKKIVDDYLEGIEKYIKINRSNAKLVRVSQYLMIVMLIFVIVALLLTIISRLNI